MFGAMINDVTQSDYAYTLDNETEYSDRSAGYEVIKYAKSEPAVMVVRNDEGQFQLYEEVGEGDYRLLDDSEGWALTAKIATILQDRRGQLIDINAPVPQNVFLPEFYRISELTQTWKDESGQYFRHVSGLEEIEFNVSQLPEKYMQETQEWTNARANIVEGAYQVDIDPDKLNGMHNAEHEHMYDGARVGGGLGVLAVLLMLGKSTMGGYRRRVRRAKEDLAERAPRCKR